MEYPPHHAFGEEDRAAQQVGPVTAGSRDRIVDIEGERERVGTLLRLGRWREALDSCAEGGGGLLPEVIHQVGHRAFNEGEFSTLLDSLLALPQAALADEAVAYWAFVAATAVNRQAEVLPTVSAVLASAAAPDLRAAVAVTRPGDAADVQTRMAVEARETPATVRARAFALALEGDRLSPLALFRRAMAMAESSDAGHLVVACAVDLANQEIALGHYKSGRDWARWALEEQESRGLKEALRRDLAAATIAYAHLLLGEVEEARTRVASTTVDLDRVGIPSYEAVVSTAGDMLLVDGKVAQAERLFSTLRRRSPLTLVASASLDVTKARLAAGDVAGAREEAEYAYSLSRGASRAQAALGTLGLGMALTRSDPRRAAGLLETAARQLELTNLQVLQTQALLWLAKCQLAEGRIDDAARALAEGHEGTRELGESGWALLMGLDPDHVRLRALARGDGGALKLRLLGGAKVESGEVVHQLSIRHGEVLAVLCDREGGATTDDLRRLVFDDSVEDGTVKSTVSRLRQIVPISSSPYRIEAPFECDFKLVLGLLGSGRVHQAVQHYAGELLPGSRAPGVVDLRLHIEECLRRAVIASGDPDLLIQLGTVLGDDLQVWEAAKGSLPSGDYRMPLVSARLRRVREEWAR